MRLYVGIMTDQNGLGLTSRGGPILEGTQSDADGIWRDMAPQPGKETLATAALPTMPDVSFSVLLALKKAAVSLLQVKPGAGKCSATFGELPSVLA